MAQTDCDTEGHTDAASPPPAAFLQQREIYVKKNKTTDLRQHI